MVGVIVIIVALGLGDTVGSQDILIKCHDRVGLCHL